MAKVTERVVDCCSWVAVFLPWYLRDWLGWLVPVNVV